MIPASKVIVQNAVDESVYFVEGVEYKAFPAEYDVQGGDVTKFSVFVCFTPSNGHNKGERHDVPISRVIAVIGAEA